MTGFSFIHAGLSSSDSQRASGGGAKQTSISELQNRLDRTVLACEAMWTIMRDKLKMSDEELVQRIHDIDLSDGKLDGKVRKTAVSCPSCGRTIPRKFPKCMYCGQLIVHDPFV